MQGRLIMPGFNDAHIHLGVDPDGLRLPLRGLGASWEETKAAIEVAVRQTPLGTWIFGMVGATVVMNEDVTRFALDAIAPNHPVLLRAYYGHGYVASSKAMPLLQITGSRGPAGGYLERVSGAKKVNGRFWEDAEWRPNRSLAGQVSDEAIIKTMRGMAQEAVGYGITSMQMFSPISVDRFARLLVRARLPIRIRAIPFPLTDVAGRDLAEIRGLTALTLPPSRVTASGIKWVLDGTPFERGAVLRRPYDDRPGWNGRPNPPESDIAAIIQESLDFKQPLLLHAVGDRTVEIVFNALDRYGAAVDWPSRRVRIEHGDGVVGDLVSRALKLGVIVVQNPTHFSEPELCRRRWGTTMMPLRSLIDAGIPVALGSDGPMNPFLSIMFAASHPYNPREAITREQAVRAYTHGSAFAEFTETEKGTLSSGKLADVIMLSEDILAAPLPVLPRARSVLTIVGGEVVYDANVVK